MFYQNLEDRNDEREEKMYSSMCKSNGHDGCSFHNPWKWIPHEPQELEYFTLLFLLKFVVTKQGKTLLHFSRGQPFFRALEMLKNLFNGNILLQGNDPYEKISFSSIIIFLITLKSTRSKTTHQINALRVNSLERVYAGHFELPFCLSRKLLKLSYVKSAMASYFIHQ